jgi:hypothetical protein
MTAWALRQLTGDEAKVLAEGVGSPEYRAFLVALKAAYEACLAHRMAREAVVVTLKDDPCNLALIAEREAAEAAAYADYVHKYDIFEGSGGWGFAPANWNGPWRFGILSGDGNYRPVSWPDGQPMDGEGQALDANGNPYVNWNPTYR